MTACCSEDIGCVTGSGKLFERSQKIAYNLLKVGASSKGDTAVKPADRVRLSALCLCL